MRYNFLLKFIAIIIFIVLILTPNYITAASSSSTSSTTTDSSATSSDSTESSIENIQDIMDGADNFKTLGSNYDGTTISNLKMKDSSNMIYNILFGIGILVVLVVGSILGIKFMLVSAEDKADIKEALVPYIVGSVIIFGAFGIWKIAVIIGSNF